MSSIVDKVRPPKIVIPPKAVGPKVVTTARPKPTQAPAAPVSAGPGSGDVGFMLQAAAGETFVCLLAWPLVANSWPELARHWQALRANREFSTATAPVQSWVADLAPNLCAPFRDANSAESTIGAALARLPIGLAVGIASAGDDAVLGCLDHYVSLAASERRAPLRLIVSDNGMDQERWQQISAKSWRISLLQDWHRQVLVKPWRDPSAPLPLELCRLVATATARKVAEPTRWNPIYDGAESKIRVLPVALKALQRRGKKP